MYMCVYISVLQVFSCGITWLVVMHLIRQVVTNLVSWRSSGVVMRLEECCAAVYEATCNEQLIQYACVLNLGSCLVL